jgi:hypothetical protein
MRFFLTLALFLNLGLSFGQDNIDPDKVTASSKSLNVYTENGRMGLKKNMRKYITPAIYDTLFQYSPTVYVGQRYSSTKQASLWGAIKSNGEVLLPFKYLTLNIEEGLFIIGYAENNKMRFGVSNLEGNTLVLPKYNSIKILSQGLIEGRTEGKTILFDQQGQKQAEFVADSITFLNRSLIKVHRQGKVGVKAMNNTDVLPLEYRDVRISDSIIYVQKYPEWYIIQGYDSIAFYYDSIRSWGDNYIASSGTKHQVVDRNTRAKSLSYDSIYLLNDKIAYVKNGANWGAINNNGEEIIPLTFAELFADNVILAAKEHGEKANWTIFDLYGFPKTKLNYSSVRASSEGRIPIKRNGKWGYLDHYGVEIISPIFDSVDDFYNGMAAVMFFGEGGIIDRAGKWVMTPEKNKIIDFNEKVILRKNRGNIEVLDFENKLIYFSENELEISKDGLIEYDSIGEEIRTISWQGTITTAKYYGQGLRTGGNGYFIFKENGRYGFMDYQGRIRIANRYEEVKPFHQDFAAIMINNKWGFIDLNESIVVQPMYDSVGYFVDSNCITVRNSSLGVINSSGQEIVKNAYQDIIHLSDGKFRVKQNNKWGVLSETGSVIIHPRYDKLIDTNRGYFIVQKNGKYGTIDGSGVSKIPLLYDYIGYNPQSKTFVTKKSTKQKWTPIKEVHFTE